jgi:NAD(P)-dependent dehydrogenase (short-subunit alcohol dehydrogenase family)/acyl dehydratase
MTNGFPDPAVFAAEDLRVGLAARFEREISEADVRDFARMSGDANPLHIDAEYAAGSNFGGPIVHGAFQVGLASAFIGMHLPGRNVLLGSVSARFPAPLYYPCRVTVSGEVASWNLAARAGSIRVTVQEAKSQTTSADIHLNFTLHEQRTAVVSAAPAASPRAPESERDIVVVTGARGGLGSTLVSELAAQYTVVAMARQPMNVEGDVLQIAADLQDGSWRDPLLQVLQGRRIHGIVHTAWPGQPHGSLLQVDPCVIQQQLSFAALTTTELARFLFQQTGSEGEHRGGRLIVLGSIVGTQKPVLPLASYSLGKATLEHTVRLLAPELARRGVTINAITPSFMPTGMNRQATERQQMKEAALVPMGRLCEPGDVTALVRYLLSPEAAFVSGQIIGLTGAQL